MLVEAISEIRSKGEDIVSLICDNAPVNARTFEFQGDYNLFLVYDYVHIYKNIRNN